MNIDGEYLYENQGLKMNKSKTKVMMEKDTHIYVNNTQIANVESYIYHGQRCSTRDKNQGKKIQRRIAAGWTTFAKHRDIFKACEETNGGETTGRIPQGRG